MKNALLVVGLVLLLLAPISAHAQEVVGRGDYGPIYRRTGAPGPMMMPQGSAPSASVYSRTEQPQTRLVNTWSPGAGAQQGGGYYVGTQSVYSGSGRPVYSSVPPGYGVTVYRPGYSPAPGWVASAMRAANPQYAGNYTTYAANMTALESDPGYPTNIDWGPSITAFLGGYWSNLGQFTPVAMLLLLVSIAPGVLRLIASKLTGGD